MRTKKNNYLVFILLVIISLVSGCKKNNWFDVKSDKQLAVPSTLKDMQSLMDNATAMNSATPGLAEIASDEHYISENAATTLTNYELNAYTWSKEFRYENVADWNIGGVSISGGGKGSYVRVYYANLLLDGLVKIIPIGQAEQILWNNIKGQALFHRAHAFYELAQVFAPPFERETADIKLGIPLRLESDINITSKRSTVLETYDQIINDLMLAKDLLPGSPAYKTRPSKPAVYALLARVYLSMQNYDRAGSFATSCLNNYSTLIDYSSLGSITTANPFTVYNHEIIFYSSLMQYTPLYFSNLLIDNGFYNSYDFDDLRKSTFFNFSPSENLVTYKGTYCGSGFNECFSGLATDEVYLIRAECNARAGNVTAAMSDLNTLLKTRWLSPYSDLVAGNASEALRIILRERKKELILRGTRWSDLRRLNRDPRFAIKLTRTIGDKTYTLEPNSYKYTFPIPDNIIEMTGMEQNEGWK